MQAKAKAGCAVVVTLVLVGMLATATAGAADWKKQQLSFSPRYDGDRERGHILGISCPTRLFCVAGNRHGRLAVSSNPTGGPAEWKIFFAPEGSDIVSPPPPGAPTIITRPSIGAVSCPTTSFCVAVSAQGDAYISSDPLGGTASWSRADLDGDDRDTHLESVSCPTTSFCVAVSGGPHTGGKVLWSTDPAAGSSTWRVTQLDRSLDLRGVSCPSPSLCVAVGEDGRIVVSAEPRAGASAWRDVGAPGGPGHLRGIACTGGLLCVTGNAGGNLLIASDPLGSPSRWLEWNGGGSVQITAVSCPTASHCIAVDNNGDVLTSNDPLAGPASWSFENVIPYVLPSGDEPPFNGMFGVSCPSTAFCAIAAADGQVLTSTNPFDGPSSTAGEGHRVRRPKRPKTILAHVDRKRVRSRTNRVRARFRFYADGPVRRFICKRDRKPYRPCRSPVGYWVGLGRHVFRVRAIGITGLKGPVALDRFTIVPARTGSRATTHATR